MPEQVEIAWAAGFFDGEGDTGVRSNKRGHLRIQVAQSGSPELLDRFRKAVGEAGTVMGPYGPYTTQKKPYYLYAASNEGSRKALAILWPYLSSPKREQAEKAGYEPCEFYC